MACTSLRPIPTLIDRLCAPTEIETGRARRAEAILRQPTVLLADGHMILTEGIRLVLEPSFCVVGTARDGRALLEAATRLRPDVIVVDVSLPLLNGIEAVRVIKSQNPKVKVVYLTTCSSAAMAAEAMAAGGSAYVLKTASAVDLVKAIRQALNGGTYVAPEVRDRLVEFPRGRFMGPASRPKLTLRETEVLQLIAEGRRTKEVAHLLSVSPRTVEFHKYRITDKLGISTTAELTQYAMRNGVVPA